MKRILLLSWFIVCFVLFFYSAWVGVFFLLLIGFAWQGRVQWKMLGIVGLVLVRLWVWSYHSDESLIYKNDDGVAYNLTGQICLEPDIRRNQVKYILCIENDNFLGFRNRVLWVDGFLSSYEIGQKLELSCKLEEPFEEVRFSYKNYLRIFRVDSICKGRVISELEVSGYGGRRIILRVKNMIIDFFDRKLLEPVSSLMNGILLGTRRGFADGVMDDFARTGLTHIIAVSGYNVALVILVVDYIFGFVPRLKRVWVHLIFLICFAFITGLSASVIRATISGVFSLVVLKEGLNSSFVKVILWVIVLMTFWNPAFLFFDVSFHLSVLATLGVVFGGSYCKKTMSGFLEADKLGFKEAFMMTVFAQVFTMPVVILKFDYLSLISPVANVLVAPFLPILMLLGCVLILGGWLMPWFGWVLVFGIEILGRLFFVIVNICAKVDWLVWGLEGINRRVFFVVYMVLLLGWILYVLKKHYREEIRKLILS